MSAQPPVILSEREESGATGTMRPEQVAPITDSARRTARRSFAFAQDDNGAAVRDGGSSVVGRTRKVELLRYAAPVAAIIAGVSAEWLDFRAVRYPILLMMLAALVATTYAMEAVAVERGAVRPSVFGAMLRAVLLGVVTWVAAQTVYVILHMAQGERFDAPRFGPQPLQALGLISAHALFLGAPTGLAAGAILHAYARLRRRHGA